MILSRRTRSSRRFDRQWWLSGGYSFCWVAVITILVWSYADQEVATEKEFTVTLRLVMPGDPANELKTRMLHPITVRVQGNRTAVDRLVAGKGKIKPKEAIQYEVVDRPGKYYVTTKDTIDEELSISKQGLSVLSVTPSVIEYEVRPPEMDFRATLGLVADESSGLFLTSTPTSKVHFRLKGAKASLAGFAEALKEASDTLAVAVSNGRGPGRYKFPTEALLAANPLIAKHGLAVVKVYDLEVIDVELDKLIEKTVRVEFKQSGSTLAEALSITPPQVRIRVGEASWQAILAKRADPAVATKKADLTGVDTTNGVGTLKIALDPQIEGINIEPVVKTVAVKFRITGLSVEKKLQVGVRVLAPIEWSKKGVWARYALEQKDPNEWWPTITVRGPQTDLEQLSSDNIDAYISLTNGDEKPPNFWGRKVVIQFPPDLDVQLVGEPPEVQLKLVLRTDAPP